MKQQTNDKKNINWAQLYRYMATMMYMAQCKSYNSKTTACGLYLRSNKTKLKLKTAFTLHTYEQSKKKKT